MGERLANILHTGSLVVTANDTSTNEFELFAGTAFDDDWGVALVHIDSTSNLDDVTLTFIRTSAREIVGVSRSSQETASSSESFVLNAANTYTADIVGTRWRIRTTAAEAVELVYRDARAVHPEITNAITSALVIVDDLFAVDIETDTSNFDGYLSSTHAEVQAALDRLDDVVASDIPVDASGFDENLETTDDTVQKVAQKFDDFQITDIEEYEFGRTYVRGEISRYQDVLYRVLTNHTSSEIPPLDPTNFSELTTHRLEGYGEVASAQEAEIDFATIGIEANNSNDSGYSEPLSINLSKNLPQAIVFRASGGVLESRVDGTVLTFPSSEDYEHRLVTTVSANTTLDIFLQARINNSGAWTTIKRHNAVLSNEGVNAANTLTLSSGTDVTFTLDDGEDLYFKYVINATAGGITNGLISHLSNSNLVMHVTGIVETRHVLAHGTGSYDGQIVIEDSSTGVVTPIIDVDDDVEYVGPTKLAGLDDSLSEAEQIAIRTKIGSKDTAGTISIDATGFDGVLRDTDDTVQKVANRVDSNALALADAFEPVSNTQSLIFRPLTSLGTDYTFDDTDQIYFSLTTDANGLYDVTISQPKSSPQPDFLSWLAVGTYIFIRTGGKENLYQIESRDAVFSDSADDFEARTFRSQRLRGDISTLPASGAAVELRTGLSPDMDLSRTATDRIPVKTTPIAVDHVLMVNSVNKRVSQAPFSSGVGGAIAGQQRLIRDLDVVSTAPPTVRNTLLTATGNTVNALSLVLSGPNADAVDEADMLLIYTGSGTNFDTLQGEFQVTGISETNITGNNTRLIFSGVLTPNTPRSSQFTTGSSGDTARVIFLDRRDVTAWVRNQVQEDLYGNVAGYNDEGHYDILDSTEIAVDASAFDRHLESTDDNLQAIADALDQLDVSTHGPFLAEVDSGNSGQFETVEFDDGIDLLSASTAPRDIGILPNGDYVLIDDDTSRVYTYSQANSAWNSFSIVADNASNPDINNPRAVAVDNDGNIVVVAASLTRRFYTYANGSWDDGVLLPTALTQPRGVDINDDGDVAVGDRPSGTNQIFQYSSGAWDSGLDAPTGTNNLRSPAYDTDGNLTVLMGDDRIYTYSGSAWDSGYLVLSGANTVEAQVYDTNGDVVVLTSDTSKIHRGVFIQNYLYTLTADPAITSYYDGLTIQFFTHASVSGPAYINLDGLGQIPLWGENGQIDANTLIADRPHLMVYDGGQFHLTTGAADDSKADTDLANVDSDLTVAEQLTLEQKIGGFSHAGRQLAIAEFEIVSTDPPTVDNTILHASGNDVSSFTMVLPNTSLAAATADIIMVYEEVANGFGGLAAEFQVTSTDVSAVDLDSTLVTFTGRLTLGAAFRLGLNAFSLGTVGNDVRLYFLERRDVTAWIEQHGDPNTQNHVFGYNDDGSFDIITADEIGIDDSSFDNNLAIGDDTLQTLADEFDQITVSTSGPFPTDVVTADSGALTSIWNNGLDLPAAVTAPRSLAIFDNGDYAVLDSTSKRVVTYDQSAGTWSSPGFDANGGTPDGTDPVGIAVDQSDVLLMVDSGTTHIYEYVGGAFVGDLDLDSAITTPRDIAVTKVGTETVSVIGSEASTDSLWSYLTIAWSESAALPSLAHNVTGLAYSHGGTTSIVDDDTDLIYTSTASGFDAGSTLPSGATAPRGLDYNADDQAVLLDLTTSKIYVGDLGNFYELILEATPTADAYYDGLAITFTPHEDVSGDVIIDLDGLGRVELWGAAGQVPAATLKADRPYQAVYGNSRFNLVGTDGLSNDLSNVANLTETQKSAFLTALSLVQHVDVIYWPDRDGDIAENTLAINSGGRAFVARTDILTTDGNYDSDPDTNTAGVRAAWEATHLQNTHGYIDGNEFIIIFGERNNLQALEIEMGISLDVASSFSRLMLIFREGEIFFATNSEANPSDLETERIQPNDGTTFDNAQDFIKIGGDHINGYTFRLGDGLVRYESLKSGLQDVIDGKLDIADTSVPLSHTHTLSFRDRSGSNYDFTAADQVFFNLTQDTDGYYNVILSQLKTDPQPNFHNRLVAGSRILLLSSAAGTENLYIVKDPHSTITDAADDFQARIFRCELLRGDITVQPAQSATMHLRTDLSVDLDLSNTSTDRIPVLTSPVDADELLVVDATDKRIKRVGWDDLPSVATVGVVAYEAAMTQVTSWFNASWENVYGTLTPAVNLGPFTVVVDSGDRRVVIPEDGVYAIHVSYYADLNNDSNNQRFGLNARIRRDANGTLSTLGQESTSYMRGLQGGASFTNISATATCVMDLDEDDEIFGEVQGIRENSGTSGSVDGTISIFKLNGATGATGAQGDQGDDGTDGEDGIDGAQFPTFGDAGQALVVNEAQDGVEWANTSILEFAIGDDYPVDTMVRYQDVLYRANTAIADADTIPSLDSDFSPIASHRVEGFGESADETPARFDFNDVDVTAHDPNLAILNLDATVRVAKGLPQGIVSINSDGWLQAHTDGVELKFDADDSAKLQIQAGGTEESVVSIKLEGGIDGSGWVTIKSGLALFTAVDISATAIMSNTSDVTFDLDTDEELQFRYVYTVTQGSRAAGQIIRRGAIDRYTVLVTGTVGAEHWITFNSDADVIFHNSVDDTDTVIIDVDGVNGPTYIGPTDLSGLDDDLTSTEQAAIRTKLGTGDDYTGDYDIDFLRPTGRAFELTGRHPSFSGIDQIRVGTQVSVTEDDSKTGFRFDTDLRVGDIFEVRDGSNWEIDQITSATYGTGSGRRQSNFNVTRLRTNGTLDVETNDDVVLTTTYPGEDRSVVAYRSDMVRVMDWFNGSWENLYTSLATDDINEGGFTISTVSGDDRVDIPEDGLYYITLIYSVDANNESVADAEFFPQGRIRIDRNGSVNSIGIESRTVIESNAGGGASRGSLNVVSLADLQEDDEIWGEVRASRNNSATTAVMDGSISIVKVNGAKGKDGEGIIFSRYGLPSDQWKLTELLQPQSASGISIDTNIVWAYIIQLDPDPETNYSYIFNKVAASDTGNIRQALYLWSESNSRWERDAESATAIAAGDLNAGGITSDHQALSGLKLSSEHAGSTVQGYALITLQTDTADDFRYAVTGASIAISPAFTMGLLLSTAYGTSAPANITESQFHPAGATQVPYIAKRKDG